MVHWTTVSAREARHFAGSSQRGDDRGKGDKLSAPSKSASAIDNNSMTHGKTQQWQQIGTMRDAPRVAICDVVYENDV